MLGISKLVDIGTGDTDLLHDLELVLETSVLGDNLALLGHDLGGVNPLDLLQVQLFNLGGWLSFCFRAGLQKRREKLVNVDLNGYCYPAESSKKVLRKSKHTLRDDVVLAKHLHLASQLISARLCIGTVKKQ